MQLVDAAANPCNALIWSHHWWALPVAKLSPYIEPGTEAREQAEPACPVFGASRQRTGVELISKTLLTDAVSLLNYYYCCHYDYHYYDYYHYYYCYYYCYY